MNETEERLTRVFSALADPTRRTILARLRRGEASVTELVAELADPISQPAVSRHLRVLGEAGLVTRSRRATARPSHLEAGPLADAAAWLAGYRAHWQERHDRLDALLVELQEEDPS